MATQWCSKHTSAAVKQHATIDVFCVGVAPKLYNEDLRQLRVKIEGGSEDNGEDSNVWQWTVKCDHNAVISCSYELGV